MLFIVATIKIRGSDLLATMGHNPGQLREALQGRS